MNPDQPEPDGEPPESPSEQRMLSSGFGAATGLVCGVGTAQFLAALLYDLSRMSRWAEIFWSVAAPLLAILGAFVGSFLFRRFFQTQVIVPALLFMLVFLAAAWWLVVAVGFPWVTPTPPP